MAALDWARSGLRRLEASDHVPPKEEALRSQLVAALGAIAELSGECRRLEAVELPRSLRRLSPAQALPAAMALLRLSLAQHRQLESKQELVSELLAQQLARLELLRACYEVERQRVAQLAALLGGLVHGGPARCGLRAEREARRRGRRRRGGRCGAWEELERGARELEARVAELHQGLAEVSQRRLREVARAEARVLGLYRELYGEDVEGGGTGPQLTPPVLAEEMRRLEEGLQLLNSEVLQVMDQRHLHQQQLAASPAMRRQRDLYSRFLLRPMGEGEKAED
uniref:Uncharacterized protein LOC116957719 n=1 Tax=Petromyzon marinus TaxID=7757 RepID=A0AAJ7UGA5_PETMA|nr:uncharacterized protein LOC116957719 [Petromyzon marinus]